MLTKVPMARLLNTSLVLLCAAAPARAQQVEDAAAAAERADRAARASQARIDGAVDETRDLARQYATVTKELDGLQVYNTLLEKQFGA